PVAHHPRARDRHPGDLAGRGRHRRAAPPDAAVVDRGVRRPDPPADPPRRREAVCHRSRAGRLPGPRAGRSAAGPVRRTGRWRRPEDDPERLVILQLTSGSTADPKGVMLPDRVVQATLDAIEVAAQLDPDEDVLVSWLPLYHDMGLVGMLTLPMTPGTRLVLG